VGLALSAICREEAALSNSNLSFPDANQPVGVEDAISAVRKYAVLGATDPWEWVSALTTRGTSVR